MRCGDAWARLRKRKIQGREPRRDQGQAEQRIEAKSSLPRRPHKKGPPRKAYLIIYGFPLAERRGTADDQRTFHLMTCPERLKLVRRTQRRNACGGSPLIHVGRNHCKGVKP